MPKRKFITRTIIFTAVLIFVSFGVLGGIKFKRIMDFELVKESVAVAGAFTYPLGLTALAPNPCVTTPTTPPACEGLNPATSIYCKFLSVDVSRGGGFGCVAYSEVHGTPAGGAGTSGLFLKTSLAAAGVTPGGQLIAGCYGPTLCDQGPLASYGGCVNCYSKLDKDNWFRIVKKSMKTFITSFKE